jgi:uncharacterized membrane protein YbhN (UPF0104 family)
VRPTLNCESRAARWRRPLLRLLQVLVIGVTGGYVARALWRNWDQVAALNLQPRPALYAAAAILGGLYLLGRAWLWHRIVSRVVGQYPWQLNAACWLGAALGKYLPGKVFLLLGRVYVYRRYGASATLIGVGFLLESAALFLTCLLLVGVSLGSAELGLPRALRFGLPVLAALLLLLSHPTALRWGLKAASRVRALPTELPHYRFSDGLGWTLHMAADWLVLGSGLYCLANSLLPLSPSYFLPLTTAYAVAGSAGILVVVAPSGIGVREGVLTALLAPLLGVGPAAALAVLARLWTTLVEVIAALFAIHALRRMHPDEKGQC